MIAAFAIWSVLALVFIWIGFRSYRSDTPAGFYANSAPPEVKDTPAYNHAVGKLWWTAAVIFELIGTSLLFMKQNSVLVMIPYLLTVFWALGLLLAYQAIESKHRL